VGKTLGEFVRVCTAESAEFGAAPCLLDAPGKSFLDYGHRTHLPIAPFRSEFIGMSKEELVPIFREMVGGEGDGIHANCNFVVLDEQTLRDGTCCGVSLLADFQTLRADFTMAIEILCAAEINLESLDEGAFSEFYERGEAVTVEGWEQQNQRWEAQRQEQREATG
jgi:hypothetical protein